MAWADAFVAILAVILIANAMLNWVHAHSDRRPLLMLAYSQRTIACAALAVAILYAWRG